MPVVTFIGLGLRQSTELCRRHPLHFILRLIIAIAHPLLRRPDRLLQRLEIPSRHTLLNLQLAERFAQLVQSLVTETDRKICEISSANKSRITKREEGGDLTLCIAPPMYRDHQPRSASIRSILRVCQEWRVSRGERASLREFPVVETLLHLDDNALQEAMNDVEERRASDDTTGPRRSQAQRAGTTGPKGSKTPSLRWVSMRWRG